MNVNQTTLLAELKRDEGFRKYPYTDTEGKLTIGVGHNLTDNGLPDEIIYQLLHHGIDKHAEELDRIKPNWVDHPEPVQRALLNMCFNMGAPRLEKFAKMWAALDAGDYHAAANEALDSRWAKQVGMRSTRMANLIREGAK